MISTLRGEKSESIQCIVVLFFFYQTLNEITVIFYYFISVSLIHTIS